MRRAAAARWTRTSDTLILHGRRICKPKPLCDQCAVRDECDYYQSRSAQPEAARQERPVDTRAEFERLVADALGVDPAPLPHAMQNIAIVVEDEPSRELLDEMEIEPPDTLLGLYQGTPLTERAGTTATRCPIASCCSRVRSSATARR